MLFFQNAGNAMTAKWLSGDSIKENLVRICSCFEGVFFSVIFLIPVLGCGASSTEEATTSSVTSPYTATNSTQTGTSSNVTNETGFYQTETGAALTESGTVVTETGDAKIVERGFADVVVSFDPGDGAGFGADKMPDVVLGPPLGGGALSGSMDVVSLGNRGVVVLELLGVGLVDGPGVDLLVFENPYLAQGRELCPGHEEQHLFIILVFLDFRIAHT